MITIYTDGACKGNGKTANACGGYGAYIQYSNGNYRKIWGGEPATTNNRMELTAAIKALEACQDGEPITLFTDSNYVKDGITKWIVSWKAKNWKKSDGKAVLNVDLWRQLDALNERLDIHWQWVKGHNGDTGNEMADLLANEGTTSTGNQLFSSTGELLSDSTQNNQITANTPSNSNTMPNSNTPSDSLLIHEPTMSNLFYSNFEQNPDYDGDTSRINPDFWPILPDPINQNMSERQLIMDTETTGFDDKGGDRIVEIGAIELVGRKFTGQKLHVYINPHMQMDDEVIGVHGISNDFVSDKPTFEDVAQRVFDFMKGAEVIAHNASFDMRFLDMEFTKAGLPKLSDHVKVVDSLVIAKQMYPGQKNTLNALVKRLGVGQKDRTFHGALLDSEILAEVYLAMTGGQVSFDMDETPTLDRSTTLSHDNLSHMANMLSTSVRDDNGDSQWRNAHLSS